MSEPASFERPDERRELRFHLEQRRNLLMLAPRRVGKSWLMKRVAEDLRATWAVVECNVEGMSTEREFFSHICACIENESNLTGAVGTRLRQLLGQIGTKDLAGSWQSLLNADPRVFATTLVQRLAAQDQETVILIDELALFVMELQKRDPDATRTFLYHLRRLRQDYPKVRWFFTGSIGLDTIGRRDQLAGALIDLRLFSIQPFDEVAARAYLEHLCVTKQVFRPFALDPEAFAHLSAQLGWLSPFYLDLVAGEIVAGGDLTSDGRRLATVADIDRAFAAMLLPAHRNYFAAWEEHITKNFDPAEAIRLRQVLRLLAAHPDGELWDTLSAKLSGPPHNNSEPHLREAMSVLTTDGYLAESEEDERVRYRFRSGLLRRYWKRYHVA